MIPLACATTHSAHMAVRMPWSYAMQHLVLHMAAACTSCMCCNIPCFPGHISIRPYRSHTSSYLVLPSPFPHFDLSDIFSTREQPEYCFYARSDELNILNNSRLNYNLDGKYFLILCLPQKIFFDVKTEFSPNFGFFRRAYFSSYLFHVMLPTYYASTIIFH